MRTLIAIGCGARKAPGPCAAVDLYQGILYRATLRHARARGGPHVILSARYGALDPARVIERYDAVLATAAARRDWSRRVAGELLALTESGDTIEAYAGAWYLGWRDELAAAGRVVVAPLEGLGIGRRLALLAAPDCWVTGGAP